MEAPFLPNKNLTRYKMSIRVDFTIFASEFHKYISNTIKEQSMEKMKKRLTQIEIPPVLYCVSRYSYMRTSMYLRKHLDIIKH